MNILHAPKPATHSALSTLLVSYVNHAILQLAFILSKHGKIKQFIKF